LSLGKGREAIWDLTTVLQAGVKDGHSWQYAMNECVDYAVDLVYTRR
jgi:hypothetical protein